MSNKKKFLSFITLLLFFIFPSKIFALTINIDGVTPIDISNKEQEISINLTVTDLPTGDSYFRVGVSSGSTYVGYVKDNVGNWIKLLTLSEDKQNLLCNNYFKILTDGTYILNFKVGGDIDIDNGGHTLKAHRFTSSCGSYTGSNEFSINVNLPTPTPTTTPTPTDAPTQEPTKTPSSTPTVTSTPKPTPTKTATPKSTITSTPKPTDDMDTIIEPILVGLNNDDKTPEEEVLGESTTKKPPFVPIIFISSGLLFMSIGGVSLFKKMKTEYNKQYEK